MGERGGNPRPCLRGNRVRRRAFGRASGHRGACGQARRGRHGARAFRRAHRRRRHAPLRYARKRQHPGRFARRGCTMPAPCAPGRVAAQRRRVGRVDRLRGALSLREPGSRASHDGEQGACSLHARRRFRGALLRACAPAARCYNEVHRRGVFAVARHRHAGALHPRAQRGDASAGGRPVACDQGLGNRRRHGREARRRA